MIDEDQYEVTKKHFEMFRAEALAWIKIFKLDGRCFEIKHINPLVEDARASCGTLLEDKMIIIRLAEEWDIKPTDRNIKETAFHEVAEALLGELHDNRKE